MKPKAGSKARAPSRVFSPADMRRVLLEHRFLLSADEVCAKWGITRSTLREWKKIVRFEYLSPSIRELVIAALASGGRATLTELAAWADHQDHCPYMEAEIRVVVEGLVAEGIAVWEGESQVRHAPSEARLAERFVF